MTHYKLTSGGELAAIPESKCKAGDFVICWNPVNETYHIARVDEVRGDAVFLDTGNPDALILTAMDNILKVLT